MRGYHFLSKKEGNKTKKGEKETLGPTGPMCKTERRLPGGGETIPAGAKTEERGFCTETLVGDLQPKKIYKKKKKGGGGFARTFQEMSCLRGKKEKSVTKKRKRALSEVGEMGFGPGGKKGTRT